MSKRLVAIVIVLAAFAAVESEAQTSPAGKAPAANGMQALDRAAKAHKTALILFYKTDDAQTRKMRQVLDATIGKLADRAQPVIVDVSASSEQSIVRKFRVERAPMPLVLAVAPNGAITGGFPTTVSEEQLTGALAGPAMAQCLKALQSRKLVLLCVQNQDTKHNRAAMSGVRGFKADSRFAQATEIVSLNPRDPVEASFLKKLNVAPTTEEAVTVFLAPPGSILAKYEGATDKDTMVATLMKAMSSCGSGCGSGGCR